MKMVGDSGSRADSLCQRIVHVWMAFEAVSHLARREVHGRERNLGAPAAADQKGERGEGRDRMHLLYRFWSGPLAGLV